MHTRYMRMFLSVRKSKGKHVVLNLDVHIDCDLYIPVESKNRPKKCNFQLH